MKILSILPAIVLSGSLYAQNLIGIATDLQHISQPINTVQEPYQGSFTSNDNSPSNYTPLASTSQLYDGVLETVIGTSTYDLQTNRSVQNRLVSQGNGKIAGVWTMSQSNSSSFLDRGTGYNHYDGSDWQDQPEDRIESLRTGWPSLINLDNGKEVFLSHVFTSPTGANEFGTRDTAGVGAWNMGTISDGNDDLALSWVRMTNGGTDGNTIHILGHKTFQDLVENGNNPGFMSYSRSTDGGTTWDIFDSILPEIDSSFYQAFGGDGYAMAAKGNTVAFIIGGVDRDVVLMKSTDNGSTWTKNIIWSFPIAKFDSNEDLVDSTTFDDGRINTADASYSIVIDDNDEVHTFMGNYYMSNDPQDNSSSYYPLTDGIFHWTESYGYADTTDAHQEFDTVAYMLDSLLLPSSGNPTDYIAPYFTSLSSYPHAAINTNGDIYVTYSGLINGLYEDQIGSGEEFERVYRHQFVVRSTDDGNNWSEPRDLMAEYIENNDPFVEGMYGNILLDDGDMYVMYQRDELPGISIQPANNNPHEITVNDIVIAKVSTTDFNVIGLEEETAFESFDISPNPIMNGKAFIHFNQSQTGLVQINIINMLGQQVFSQETLINNKPSIELNMNQFKSGVYFVKVISGTHKMTKKIVVQ